MEFNILNLKPTLQTYFQNSLFKKEDEEIKQVDKLVKEMKNPYICSQKEMCKTPSNDLQINKMTEKIKNF